MASVGAVAIVVLGWLVLLVESPSVSAVTNPAATITVGSNPTAQDFDATNGDLYVLNQGANTVSVISTASNSVTTTITVGTQSGASCIQAVAFDPTHNYIYVTNSGAGTVSVIAGSTNTVTSTLTLSGNPCDVLYDPANGYVYITNDCASPCTSYVYAYSGTTQKATISLPGPTATVLGYSPANSEMYVSDFDSAANSWVASAVSSSNSVVANVAVAKGALQFAYSPATQEIYCASLNNATAYAIPSSNSASTSILLLGTSPTAAGIVWGGATGDIYVSDYTNAAVDIVSIHDKAITNPSVSPFPQALAYDPASGNVYVDALVGTGNGAVDELSPAGVHVKSYTVQHGPYAITYASSNSEVYIANTGSGTVSALSSTITVTVGSGPKALAYSPASTDLYVANSAAGTVSVISSANTVTNTLTVGTNPDALVYDTSNHDIYVANRGSATVTPITSANVVGTAIGIGTSTGGPVALAFNPNNGYIYASDPAANLVSVINGATNALVATISVTSAPTTILFDGADNDVYVIESTGSAVAYISGTTVSGTISVSSSPTAMALDANTNNLYVISPASSVLSEIAVSTNTVTHTAGVSSALSVAWFPSPSIDQIAVTSSASSGTVFIFTASTLGSVGSVSVGSNPTAALVNDATGNLTVANNGSASATIVSGLDAVLGAVTVDAGPAALAMDGANGDIYVACYASGTVDVA